MPSYCDCEACRALAERYKNDPVLLDVYQRKLLIRGWAGDTDRIEKAYIIAHAEWAQANVRKLEGSRAAREAGFARWQASQRRENSESLSPESPILAE